MTLVGVATGLALGLLAKGRIGNLAAIRIRWLPLLLLAAILRMAVESQWVRPGGSAGVALVAVYGALATSLLVNRRLPGMSAAALGVVSNGAAILANGGRMPVWEPSVSAAGLDPSRFASSIHCLLPGTADFSFLQRAGPLADLIPIRVLGSVASVGDLLLAAGLGTFVFAAVVREPSLFGPSERLRPRSAALAAHPFARLASNSTYSALWMGQLISSVGDKVHQIALVFLVADLSGRPAIAVSLVFAASVVPVFVVGPLAGVLVDRSDQKQILVASDLGRAALAVSIPLAATLSVWAVLPIVFALSSLSAFFRPARSAILPRIVPEEDLLAANSALLIGDTLTETVGYALAGLFVAFLGNALALAFWVDAASYVASALLVLSVAVPTAKHEAQARAPSFLQDLAAGWQWIRQEVVLLTTTAQAVLAQTSGGAVTALSPWLMASLATSLVGREEAYGYLEASMGIGAFVGGFVVGAVGSKIRMGMTIAAAYTALGGLTIALGTSPSLYVALAAGLGFGLANVAFVVPSQTLFQLRTPPEMMGRVIAIRLALVNAVLAVAMISSGFLAEAFGVSTVLIACGIVTMLAGIAGFFVKAIREA